MPKHVYMTFLHDCTANFLEKLCKYRIQVFVLLFLLALSTMLLLLLVLLVVVLLLTVMTSRLMLAIRSMLCRRVGRERRHVRHLVAL